MKIFKDMGDELDVEVKTILQEGNVAPIIVDAADDEKANLIIKGASECRIIADWIVTLVLERSNVLVVIMPYGFSK